MKKRFLLIAILIAGGYYYTTFTENTRGNKMTEINMTATKKATFAGGCFWCMEAPFEELAATFSVTSGYTGGNEVNPTYEQVASGSTGHTEAVQIVYDPAKISYEELLKLFWQNIDPTSADGQFVDRGMQYRPEIFYHDEQQKKLAEESKLALEKSGRFDKPIVVNITKAKIFYAAEDYHQDYHSENKIRYEFYRYNSGRDQFLKKHWKPQK